jgi:hypothetical protein
MTPVEEARGRYRKHLAAKKENDSPYHTSYGKSFLAGTWRDDLLETDQELLARSACEAGEGWRKAEPSQVFYDGDQLLVAVPVNCRHGGKPYWEYSVVTVSCDSEHFSMDTHDNGWGWEWSDVEWWMPLSSYKLPVIVNDATIDAARKGVRG